jgi:hypothetical protein
MPGWSHSKKQVREALDEAEGACDNEDKACFEVADTSSSGHSWGYVRCRACGQRMSVWSTPKNADNHANQIRRFMRRHHHEEED